MQAQPVASLMWLFCRCGGLTPAACDINDRPTQDNTDDRFVQTAWLIRSPVVRTLTGPQQCIRRRQVGSARLPAAHLDVLAGILLECGGLALVDGHILGHDVLALHAALAGEAADHDGVVHVLGRLVHVGGCDHTCQAHQSACMQRDNSYVHGLLAAHAALAG